MKLTLPVILASGSPRRQTLLQKVGMSFTVTPADIDESVGPDLSPAEIVTQLALKKAQKVATHNRDSLVIGADTIVVLNGDILGKPSNRQEAVDMLGRLSGQTHEVYTGIALYAMAQGLSVSDFEMTRVTMDQISADDIDGQSRWVWNPGPGCVFRIQDRGRFLHRNGFPAKQIL